MKRHRLPIGIQDFKVLREGNYLYVDKTELIYHLVTHVRTIFLVRPRRFGKSLLCSVLKYLFGGERALFKDLWIDKQTQKGGFKWQNRPVIHLEMNLLDLSTFEMAKSDLLIQLSKLAADHNLKLDSKTPGGKLIELIRSLYTKTGERVVVLIDEYDAPIVKNITRSQIELESFKEFLRDFYGILKPADPYLHFLLLTGISKFSKISIFSALNNLQDISLKPDYAALMGYTQIELEHNFETYITEITQVKAITKKQLLDYLKIWYNGYRFTKQNLKVYNPFSILSYFEDGEFRDFWFESGHPKLLFDLMKEYHYDVRELTPIETGEEVFKGFDVDRLEIDTLMYYTGYLTIEDVQFETLGPAYYTLNFPNREVKQAFALYFIEYNIRREVTFRRIVTRGLSKALINVEIDKLKAVLQEFFRLLPYGIQVERRSNLATKEDYYQSLLYVLFILVGLDASVEAQTRLGRADLICQLPHHLYLFELKINANATLALKQIKVKQYYEKYQILYPHKKYCSVA